MKSRAVFFKGVCLACMLTLFSVRYTRQHPVDAQGILNDFKFEVFVEVSCDDATTKTLIESWINRELRKLSDVITVDQKSAHMELILRAGTLKDIPTPIHTIGYTLAIRIPETAPPQYFRPNIGVYSGTIPTLEDGCKNIVADVDIKYLEPIRRVMLEKFKKEFKLQ